MLAAIFDFTKFTSMKHEIISSQIRHLTELIQEQTETILSHQQRIPQIEMDLLLGNLRKLYESVIDLQRMQQRPEAERPTMDQVAARIVEKEATVAVNTPPLEKPIVTEETKSSVMAMLEPEVTAAQQTNEVPEIGRAHV